MTVCNFCHQEMRGNVSCAVEVYDEFPGDPRSYARIRYASDDAGRPCHDCGCPDGGLHHPGCDAEECPKCGEQAIGCGCMDEDEE